ncbi:hypothetical protein M231_07820 [Tremella mesenterica]|uniref:SET domain-containing protein n=1 Tax=Tremella mesenterica TaxID=5217 RepID=A0A4Q1BDK1_TREME|nr:hypothetical protein M231_07820 [Tremella mesenterica]
MLKFITRSLISPNFPPDLLPLLYQPPSLVKFQPRPVPHPSHLSIKPILDPSHPAHGQYGLFTKRRISPSELIIPYLGIIHHTFIPLDDPNSPSEAGDTAVDEEQESDYDLSLVRISSHDPNNPRKGWHVSIGVDAAKAGNAARFVNDYRGIAVSPNAEFRIGTGEGGEVRMEIWSLKKGLGKGEEVLVSYGKSWWNARRTDGS